MEVPSCLGHPGIGTEVGNWLLHPSNCPLLIHVYPIWPTFILISFVLLHAVFHRIFIQLSSSFPPLSILVNPMIIHFFPFKRAAPDWDDQRVDGSRHSFGIRESSWPHEISWNMELKLGISQLLFASMLYFNASQRGSFFPNNLDHLQRLNSLHKWWYISYALHSGNHESSGHNEWLLGLIFFVSLMWHSK